MWNAAPAAPWDKASIDWTDGCSLYHAFPEHTRVEGRSRQKLIRDIECILGAALPHPHNNEMTVMVLSKD